MTASTRLTLSLAVLPLLLFAAQASHGVDFPSQTLIPTAVGAGWKDVNLRDLVSETDSNCVVESKSLVTCAGPLLINALTNTHVRGDGVEIQFTNPQAGQGGVVLTSAN
ncbi:MAG: hypothetical protein ABSH33_20585, partial [Steroidobacteraceae bacterium]